MGGTENVDWSLRRRALDVFFDKNVENLKAGFFLLNFEPIDPHSPSITCKSNCFLYRKGGVSEGFTRFEICRFCISDDGQHFDAVLFEINTVRQSVFVKKYESACLYIERYFVFELFKNFSECSENFYRSNAKEFLTQIFQQI